MVTLKAARRAGVPLVVVETTDMAQTMRNVVKELNGKAAEIAVMRWDACRALEGVNEEGEKASRKMGERNDTLNPVDCLLKLADRTPERAIVFMLNAQLFWSDGQVVQGIWNLRDAFKSSGAVLVLLVPSASAVPAELKQDVVVLTDTLPTSEEVDGIIDAIATDAGLPAQKIGEREKVKDTLLGLSAFAAEQVFAMSITKEGLDKDGLWERKRKMIEQTPGLSVWRGGEKFDDIGGYENVKTFMRSVCGGRKPPRAIVFIDEIEKAVAGSGTDSTGVSQDYLRTLLTFMQDREASGVIFIGPPGSAKSMVAKATGNEAGIPTIAFDLGGMKGSLVGESETRLRGALQVVDAVSQGQTLFIATCNSIAVLPPELRRRFSFGTFFFPLPSAEDRKKIWRVWLKKYELKASEMPDDTNWTGAEIHNCALLAWRLKIPLVDAARFIVPVAVSASEQIERLCREANEKYISAAEPGLYRYAAIEGAPTQNKGRRFER